jgi:ADP-heptose:LPS heptosyltransferase
VLNLIFNRTTSGGILANCIAPRKIKIGQGAEKYRFYFNVLLHLSRGSIHMVEVIANILTEVFGIPVTQKDLALEVFVDEDSEKRVEGYLSSKRLRSRLQNGKGGKSYVVVNLSAVENARKMSEIQGQHILSVLANEMSCNIVVIAAPADEEWRDRAVRNLGSKRCWTYPDSGNAGLREIAAIVRGAKAVVTPDTAVVHLASAVKTPVLGLFTPLRVTAEWMPFKVRHRIVLAEEGSPVSSIPKDLLTSELKKFLREG